MHIGLVTTASAHLVTHENRPVAIRSQIYDVLVQCHNQSSHGGRDKTSAHVRRYYSWIPKELIARFVKVCPLCNARRTANKAYFADAENGFYPVQTIGETSPSNALTPRRKMQELVVPSPPAQFFHQMQMAGPSCGVVSPSYRSATGYEEIIQQAHASAANAAYQAQFGYPPEMQEHQAQQYAAIQQYYMSQQQPVYQEAPELVYGESASLQRRTSTASRSSNSDSPPLATPTHDGHHHVPHYYIQEGAEEAYIEAKHMNVKQQDVDYFSGKMPQQTPERARPSSHHTSPDWANILISPSPARQLQYDSHSFESPVAAGKSKIKPPSLNLAAISNASSFANQYSPSLLTGAMQETHLHSAQQSPFFPMPMPSAAIMSVPMLMERNQSIDRQQAWFPMEGAEDQQQQYEMRSLDVERVSSALVALQEEEESPENALAKIEEECNAVPMLQQPRPQQLQAPAILRSDYCYSAPLPEEEYAGVEDGATSTEMKRRSSAYATMQMQQQQMFDFYVSGQHLRPGTAPPTQPIHEAEHEEARQEESNENEAQRQFTNFFNLSPPEAVARPKSAYPALENQMQVQQMTAPSNAFLRPQAFPYLDMPASA